MKSLHSSIVILCALLVLMAVAFCRFMQHRSGSKMDQLEAIDINGSQQWLLTRAHDSTAPVVLFVHGGPGFPAMPFSRAFDEAYVQHFVLVHWDQRCAGKSYVPGAATASYAVNQIVDDGIAVVQHLRRVLKRDQLILVGHSWGAIIASAMVTRHPEYFKSYVSVGTSVDWFTGETRKFEALQRLAEKSENAELKHQLSSLGKPPYVTHDAFQELGRLWIEQMGFAGTSHRLSEQDLGEAMLKNQEYTPAELERVTDAVRVAMDVAAKELRDYSAFKATPTLPIPVYFVQGQHDTNSPTDLVKQYVDHLEAPAGKKLIVFPDSAHLPMYEQPDLFLEVLREASL